MKQTEKKKVILLLVNGYGISLGWKGNAIISAKPPVFASLWNNFPHTSLVPTESYESGSAPVNSAGQYMRFATGKDCPTSLQLVEGVLKDGTLTKDRVFDKVFEHQKIHNSNLHLFIVLSKRTCNTMFRLVQKSLEAAKLRNIFNLSFHIIADEDWADIHEFGKSLAKLEAMTAHIGIGSINSVTGGRYLFDYSFDKTRFHSFMRLLTGDARKFVSIFQLVSKTKTLPFDLPPSIIIPAINRFAKVQTFDNLILYSFENNQLQNLIFSLKNNKINNAKHLSFTILHDYDRMLVDECPRIIQDTAQANLNNILRENKYETAIISEDYRLPLIQNSFLNHSKSSGSFLIKTTTRPEVYLKKYSLIQKSILEKSLEVIGGRKFDFILIDLPALERVASTGSFAQAVDAVQYLDNFLDQIKEKSLECGYSLLFSSLYGLAEKISVVRKPVSGYSFVATTKSPLPLVLIESGLANQNTNDLHDVFHSAGRSYDLHNLILNLFSIGSDDKCKVYKKLYKSN